MPIKLVKTILLSRQRFLLTTMAVRQSLSLSVRIQALSIVGEVHRHRYLQKSKFLYPQSFIMF